MAAKNRCASKSYFISVHVVLKTPSPLKGQMYDSIAGAHVRACIAMNESPRPYVGIIPTCTACKVYQEAKLRREHGRS